MSEEEFIQEPEVLFTVEVDQKIAKDGRYTYRATKVTVETSADEESFEANLNDKLDKALTAVSKAIEALKGNEPTGE